MTRAGNRSSVLSGLCFLVDLLESPAYLLDAERRVLHANAHGLAGKAQLDAQRQRELAELCEPLAAPPHVLVHTIQERDLRLRILVEATGPTDPDAVALAYARHQGLTATQTRVFVYRVRGWSAKQIARELGRDEETIRSHLAAIRSRTGLSHLIDQMNVVRNLARR